MTPPLLYVSSVSTVFVATPNALMAGMSSQPQDVLKNSTPSHTKVGLNL